ncbi:hypothetical protein [Arthrobacter oryzae]|nr:hypothetical protein [Arthrobacter oryzae]
MGHLSLLELVADLAGHAEETGVAVYRTHNTHVAGESGSGG